MINATAFSAWHESLNCQSLQLFIIAFLRSELIYDIAKGLNINNISEAVDIFGFCNPPIVSSSGREQIKQYNQRLKEIEQFARTRADLNKEEVQGLVDDINFAARVAKPSPGTK